MKVFQVIEVNLEKERQRILKKGTYIRKQQKPLLKLCDLFEAGEWQKCLDHVRDEKAFPYNEKSEYPETEHIGIEIGRVLRDLGHYNFYTQKQLLDDAKEKLQ